MEAATSRMGRNHGTDTSILLVADGSPEQEIRPNQPADGDGGKDDANLSVEEKTYRPKDWAQEGITLMCEGERKSMMRYEINADNRDARNWEWSRKNGNQERGNQNTKHTVNMMTRK